MFDRLKKKEEELKNWFENHSKILVALSGGVDSCLLAFAGRKHLAKERLVAVIGVSPSLKQRDLTESRQFCKKNDIELIEILPQEINDPNYNSNPIDRCFYCKSALYKEMQILRDEKYPDYILVNGNNKTDQGDYRPGLKAAGNYEALSPLADCGFEKEDIRQLANKYGLSLWNKPASPCLSSRFPYGESISVEKLNMVENAEGVLNEYGFSDVRVRYKDKLARIEVPAHEVAGLTQKFNEIKSKVLEFGFSDCEIDDEGLISGKLNRDIISKSGSGYNKSSLD